ncbi:MAG: tetratricopeptide repeat protein [Alphaproteobacteria bacterium]
MEGQYSKKTLMLTAVASLVAGLVIGGLFTRAVFPPAAPPQIVDISAQLKEAHTLLDKNDLPQAEKIYLAILGRDPGNPEALSHLGNVAFQQGDVGRALRFYDMALQQDSSYAHALWDKGIALRAKGDSAGAIEAWEAFARLLPTESVDVVQVKKWIAEARAEVDSAATSQEGRLKKLFEKPPEAALKSKPVK